MGLSSLSFQPGFPFGNLSNSRPGTGMGQQKPHPPENLKAGIHFLSRTSLDISVQFHLEKGVRTETGAQFEVSRMDFSFRYEKIEFQSASGPPEGESASPWEELARHFSVENTADRITRFVTNGFGKTSFGEGTQPGARSQFVRFILPHIREGVDSALRMFGTLPPEVRENAEATYDRIQESLEEFAGENLSG